MKRYTYKEQMISKAFSEPNGGELFESQVRSYRKPVEAFCLLLQEKPAVLCFSVHSPSPGTTEACSFSGAVKICGTRSSAWGQFVLPLALLQNLEEAVHVHLDPFHVHHVPPIPPSTFSLSLPLCPKTENVENQGLRVLIIQQNCGCSFSAFEFREEQKNVDRINLVKRFPASVHLQKKASDVEIAEKERSKVSRT